MNEIVKVCKKHGALTKDQIKIRYPNKPNYSPTLICNICRREGREREKLTGYWKTPEHKAKKRAYHYRPEVIKRRKETQTIKNKIFNVKRYGLTLNEYNKMLKKQKELCGICHQKETRAHHITNKIRNLSIDHNHENGQIRGLLCARCNMIIGNIKESIGLLKNMIKYLNKYK